MSVTPGEDGEEGQDAAWQQIVANFGDRVEIEESPAVPEPEVDAVPSSVAPIPEPADDPGRWDVEEHYVPPTPPPVPAPQGPRGLAWLGLFGSPTVMLICIVFGIRIPDWVGLLLFASFVGGFGYLVATMRKHDDSDPWDDGAVV